MDCCEAERKGRVAISDMQLLLRGAREARKKWEKRTLLKTFFPFFFPFSNSFFLLLLLLFIRSIVVPVVIIYVFEEEEGRKGSAPLASRLRSIWRAIYRGRKEMDENVKVG